VLGYSTCDHIGAELVTSAIDAAVAARGVGCRGTTLHSDCGAEFTAHLTAQACLRHGLRRSMGATGVCWDNSPAESSRSTFKHEEYYRHVYAMKSELVAAVDNWVNFYNSVRRHSSIGMLSPDTSSSHSARLPEPS
jgi:putative transposase